MQALCDDIPRPVRICCIPSSWFSLAENCHLLFVGLSISVGLGGIATYVVFGLLSRQFGREFFPFRESDLQEAHFVKRNEMNAFVVGIFERLFFTLLIYFGQNQISAAIMIWIGVKGAVHFYRFDGRQPDRWGDQGQKSYLDLSRDERKTNELVRGFLALIASLVSLAFAVWGDVVAAGASPWEQ